MYSFDYPSQEDDPCLVFYEKPYSVGDEDDTIFGSLQYSDKGD